MVGYCVVAMQVRNDRDQSVDRFGQPLWQYAVLGMSLQVDDPAMRNRHVLFGVVVVHALLCESAWNLTHRLSEQPCG